MCDNNQSQRQLYKVSHCKCTIIRHLLDGSNFNDWQTKISRISNFPFISRPISVVVHLSVVVVVVTSCGFPFDGIFQMPNINTFHTRTTQPHTNLWSALQNMIINRYRDRKLCSLSGRPRQCSNIERSHILSGSNKIDTEHVSAVNRNRNRDTNLSSKPNHHRNTMPILFIYTSTYRVLCMGLKSIHFHFSFWLLRFIHTNIPACFRLPIKSKCDYLYCAWCVCLKFSWLFRFWITLPCYLCQRQSRFSIFTAVVAYWNYACCSRYCVDHIRAFSSLWFTFILKFKPNRFKQKGKITRNKENKKSKLCEIKDPNITRKIPSILVWSTYRSWQI